MGIDPVTLAIGSAVLSGVQGVAGYMESRSAAKDTKRIAGQQAELKRQESEDKARLESRSNIELEKVQKLKALKSGVMLEGSPLLLMEETRRVGDENVGNILKTGENQADSIFQSGVAQAGQLRSSGRQQLIGGLSSFASAGATYGANSSGFNTNSTTQQYSGGVAIPSRRPT